MLFNSSVPLSHDTEPACPETEAAKGNSAIIDYIIYSGAFLTVTCLSVFIKKGPLTAVWTAGF